MEKGYLHKSIFFYNKGGTLRIPIIHIYSFIPNKDYIYGILILRLIHTFYSF